MDDIRVGRPGRAVHGRPAGRTAAAMMPAAKHLDPVIGVDVHIIMVPTPAGPVPTPLPNPFVGFLFDPFDYVPIIGSTIYINNMHRGLAGTGGKTVPGIHAPLGGPFQKPPANECEMFLGSSTVVLDGDPVSYLALPALSCQDIGMTAPVRTNPKKKFKVKSLVLPTSVVLPIPLGLPVLIGGAPTISMMAMGMKLGMAALGKALKAAAKTKLGRKAGKAWKKTSDKFHKAADNLMDKLGLSKASRARNAVHKSICKVTGHPVDIATGKVFTEATDFQLPGAPALKWQRVWYSSSEYDGPLGHGWHHAYDLGLAADAEAVAVRLPDGRGLAFAALATGEADADAREGYTLSRDADGYALADRDGLIYRFAAVGRTGEENVVAIEEADGQRLNFAYDGFGRLTEIDSAAGVLRVDRGPSGRIAAIHAPRPDRIEAGPILVRYEYGSEGDLVAVHDGLGQPFRYEYVRHLLVRETDRLGYAFLFQYDGADAQARCIKTWGQDGLYAVALAYQPEATHIRYSDRGQWLYRHDGHGTVTEMTDPYGGTVQYVQDEQGRVTAEIDPNGNVTTLEYDDSGRHTRRLTCVGHPLPSEQDDPDPPDPNDYDLPETPLEWQCGGLVEVAEDTRPDSWIAAQLPPDVARALAEDQAGIAVAAQEDHDALDRLVDRHYSGGSQESWAYDAEGNVIGERDREGAVTRRQYGSWNLLLAEADPLGRVTRYEWSASEELTRLLDPGGTEHRFVYDLKDRNTEIWIDGQLVDSYVYDAADNLVESRDGSGRTRVRYEIGPGNVDAKRNAAGCEEQRFAYDKEGRLVAAETDSHKVELAYGPDGRQVKDLRDGVGIEHKHDDEDELKSSRYLGRYAVKYGRAPDDHDIWQVTDPTGAMHRFLRGWNGELLKELGNGTRILASHDAEGRCLGQHAWRAGQATWRRSYRYSPAGDLLSAGDSERGGRRYEYDAGHRLRLEQRPDGSTHPYAYDAAGNLTAGPGLAGVRVGRANRLEQANGDRLGYDIRGNLAWRQGPNKDARYHYDGLDLLVRAEINGEEWRAEYDPLCRRIAKTWRGQTTRYWWDDFRLAGEEGPDGRLRLYVYPDDRALVPFMFVDYPNREAGPEAGEAYYLHVDQVGLPLWVEDARGETVWEAEYDPYGRATILLDRGIGLNLRWPGHYHDPETGLHCNRFRYYSPELGRFIQPDPLGIEGGDNLYAYPVNPLVGVDIDGQAKCSGKAKAKKGKTGKSRKGSKKKAAGKAKVAKSQAGRGNELRKKPWVKSKSGGHTVYKNDALFDPNKKTQWREGGKVVTGTNAERMASGRAPIGHDGKAVNLHHLDQTPDGALAEVNATYHQQNYGDLHSNTGQVPSQIDRGEFDQVRKSYWKDRSDDF